MPGAVRFVLAAGALFLLPACQNEPDFDERYEAAEKKIRGKATEIDSELAKAERERAQRLVSANTNAAAAAAPAAE